MGGRPWGAPAFPIPDWEEWAPYAVCTGLDPDLFFPHPTETAKKRQAQAVCDSCPVQPECLEHAIAMNIPHGIWGGESERSRRRIRRQMGLSVARDAE